MLIYANYLFAQQTRITALITRVTTMLIEVTVYKWLTGVLLYTNSVNSLLTVH